MLCVIVVFLDALAEPNLGHWLEQHKTNVGLLRSLNHTLVVIGGHGHDWTLALSLKFRQAEWILQHRLVPSLLSCHYLPSYLETVHARHLDVSQH